MYMTVGFNQFCDAFRNSGRAGAWTTEGLQLLFEHLCDEDIELDAIALDCEWTEYRSMKKAREEIGSLRGRTILKGDVCIVVGG